MHQNKKKNPTKQNTLKPNHPNKNTAKTKTNKPNKTQGKKCQSSTWFMSICYLLFRLLDFLCASNSSNPFNPLHVLSSKEVSLVSEHSSSSPFKIEWSIKCPSSEEQGTSNFTKEVYSSHNWLHFCIPKYFGFLLISLHIEVCIELLHLYHNFYPHNSGYHVWDSFKFVFV